MTKKYLTEITFEIIGAAIEVHKIMGPGLLESVYRKCLAHEFTLRGFRYESEFCIPVVYKELELDAPFRCDFLVDYAIVVEIKAVDTIPPIAIAYLLNHMKLLETPKGIMISFNCVNLFKDGQKTYVNEFYRNLAE